MDNGKSRDLAFVKTTGDWNQKWNFDGEHMNNVRGVRLHINKGKDADGTPIYVWKKSFASNQDFTIHCTDGTASAGGLIPEKPFRLVSMMRAERAITRVGNNVKITDKSNNANQVFVYDAKTNSIQPKNDNKVVIEIGDKGKNRNL